MIYLAAFYFVTTIIFMVLYLSWKYRAEQNLGGWNDAAHHAREWKEKHDRVHKRLGEMMKFSNDNAAEIERLENRLRKFGLHEEKE
jgi:hypothetical protein